MVRDPEATRTRLIAAARAEFAQFGIAGARVDRIAEQAEANKALIYHYFGNKDGLFDAVWETLIAHVEQAHPINVRDLASFAADLSDGYLALPEFGRIVTWQRMERGEDIPLAFAAVGTRARVAAIAAAQADGTVPSRFEAAVLLGLLIHLGAFWASASPE